MLDLKQLQKKIHENAVNKGFWEVDDIKGKLCDIHSEISEALEEWKDNSIQEVYWEGDKPVGFPVELIDAIIRILDICERYNIDTEEVIKLKMAYNVTRPYKHGHVRV